MDNMNGIDPKYLALIQAGLGILAGNNGRQPVGAAIGQGLLGGIGGYQDALKQNKMLDMQNQEFAWKKLEHEQKLAEAENNKKTQGMVLASLGFGNKEPQITNANYSQQQPQPMSTDDIRKLGVGLSLSGGKGGDTLMKYADSQKPNWVNVGGKWVDANKFEGGEIPVSPAPLSEADKARFRYEGIPIPGEEVQMPQQPQSQQPQQSPATTNLSPAAQAKVNEKKAMQEIESQSPKALAEVAKIEAENKLAADKRQRGLEGQKSQANLIIGKVDEALGKVNGWSTGFVGQKLSGIGGTDSYDLNKAVDTIKANLGFQELQAMRENSPTGGALGAIAVQELQALQSTIASLDTAQSESQLKSNLAQIKTHYQNVIDTMDGKTPAGYGNVMKGNEAMPQNSPKSAIANIGGKKVPLKLGADGLYYDAQGNGYRKPK